MSAYIMGRALYHPDLTTAQKITLVAIADVVNDHGFGWMLISTLRLKTSLSLRGVQQALADLIGMGVLKRRIRRDQCSQFLIVVDQIPAKPAPNRFEADFPPEWGGAGDAPPIAGGGAGDARGGAGGAGGGAGAAPITLPEPGDETETPLSYGKDTPTEETDLFGEIQNETEAQRKQALIDLVGEQWKVIAKENPLVSDIRKMDDSRRAAIVKRGDEYADEAFGETSAFGATAVWLKIFEEINASRFLRGMSNPGKDRDSPFSVSMDWLLKKANFRKVIEGNFRDKTGGNENFDPATGRKLAAHDIARNRINERLSRSQQRAESRTDPAPDQPRRIGYSSPSGR